MGLISQSGKIMLIIADIKIFTLVKANFKKSTFYVELKQKPPVIHTGGFCLVLNCVYYTLKSKKVK